MRIPESSKVEFYSKIRINKGETIPFKSRKQLEAYFALHKAHDAKLKDKKFSYIRRNGSIKVELSTKEVEQCNYFMFYNPAFENIKYYCRIRDWEYVNNQVTEVFYDIDTWCTYFEKVTYSTATIEREHLSSADYEKSLQNPYDPTIYEFQTEEGLRVDPDMEVIYPYSDSDDQNWHYKFFPAIDRTAKKDSCVCAMVADFDAGGVDIKTFYNYFDKFVDSTGNICEPGKGEGGGALVVGMKQINVGRGYGLYECDVEAPYSDSIISWLDNESPVSKALKWLNKQGLTDQILSLFQISKKSWEIYLNPSDPDSTITIDPLTYDVKNKKLLLFPYQYLRAYNNEGDVKEYKYEKFAEVATGIGSITFRYLTLFDNIPMTSLIPMNYKIQGANMEERIDCYEFPQIGYTTNTFDSFVANQMSKNLQAHTGTIGESVSEAFSNLGTMEYHEGAYTPGVQGLKEMFGDAGVALGKSASYISQNPAALSMIGSAFTGDISGAVNTMMNLPNWDYKAAAKQWRAGDNTQAANALAGAKPAFVAYDYHPGSNNGTLGYYMPNNKFLPGSYMFLRVKLRPQILAIYDRYFTLYGYKSGRIGIPRVINYCLGKTTDLPHFQDYGDGVLITYVKTSNLHVEYVRSEVSEAIEEMFNSGVRFAIPKDMPEVE